MSENKKLFIFLSTHLIIWTLIPAISNQNLPLDTIEALAWGSNIDWGFSKHPPMSAFAVEFVYLIFGNQDWAYYLLSQLFVIFSFYIVYVFSINFLESEKKAIFSLLLLEGIFFYNFTTPEFNVNVCQLPFWALCIHYSWKCIQDNKIQNYFLLGVFAAFGILSKYLFTYLILALGIFLIILMFKEKKFKSKLLITGLALVITILPHLIWLNENNYTTILYGIHRTGAEYNALNHLINPIVFLAKQIALLVFFLLLSFSLVTKFKFKINLNDKKTLFLLFATIGPIALMFLTSVILGAKIRTMWMTPFYLFFGVLITFLLEKYINLKKLTNFYRLFVILFFLSPAMYLYISLSKDNKRTDYPGKEIAINIENAIGYKSTLISGDEWHAGNLSYHLKSRPKWVGYKKTFNEGFCFAEFPPAEFKIKKIEKNTICLDK